MKIIIAGTGSALPERSVTNDELARTVDTSDEWIRSRTGIGARHIAGPEEDLDVLGARAAEQALKMAGIGAEELGLIIYGTATAGNVTPSTACRVQARIGAVNAVCFDLNAACSGFLYSMYTAESLMRMGRCRYALIIGGDMVTRYLNWEDRSTCVLFGDAAGAAVLAATEDADAGDILSFSIGSNGAKGEVLSCRTLPEDHFLTMNGQEVFRFAVRTVPACIQDALDKAGHAKEDVKYFVLHQANARIIEAAAKRLGMPADRFPMNLADTANTSAGSIPVLLDQMNRDGRLERGDLLVLSGFGGGLTWGAAVLRY